jgi:hypothetical protein
MTLWLSHGTCSYIRVYINAVAGSVMLCLQRDFCNIIFTIENKLYIALGSAPPPPPEEGILVYLCPSTFLKQNPFWKHWNSGSPAEGKTNRRYSRRVHSRLYKTWYQVLSSVKQFGLYQLSKHPSSTWRRNFTKYPFRFVKNFSMYFSPNSYVLHVLPILSSTIWPPK